MGIGAAISAVGSVGSSLISAGAAKSAASTQAAAAKYAADLQLQEQNQVRADLNPFRTVGENATNRLAAFNQLPGITTLPPDAENSFLEATPGYQFALSQGLKSTQNSAAARGLGTSGAALK